MAMLEPALVETLAQTCMEAVKEGYDWLVAAGVPASAVRDFVLGHLRIQIAVLFGEVNGTFSDAAYKISRRARSVPFKDDWQRIFDPADIREGPRHHHAVSVPSERKEPVEMRAGAGSFAFGWATAHASPPFDEQRLLAFARRHAVPVVQIADNFRCIRGRPSASIVSSPRQRGRGSYRAWRARADF